MRDDLNDRENAEPQDRLVREAADLWLRLQIDPTNIEVQDELNAWRARSPRHERAYSAAKEVWALASEPAPASPLPPVAHHRNRVRRWRFRPRRAAVAIAGAAVAACLAIAVAPALLLAWQSDYRTGTGDMRIVALPDGSSVTLDTGSAIALSFDDRQRGVHLLAGRAWFDVVSDKAHPFVVSAEDTQVTVTGTAFDVGLDDDSVDVALARGGVRVDWNAGKRVALVPGDHFHLERASHSAVKSRMSVASMGSWRRGHLLLEDVPLSEGIDRLGRYYSGVILLTSSRLGNRRVTGVFDVQEPEDALRLMVRQHGATVREITPWLMIVSKD